MISVKSLPLFSLLTITLLAAVGNANAQQDPGYAPPPMFDDMTPPMVRPKTDNGYIVEPKASPNTQLPDDSNKKPIIVPRTSVDPNSAQQPAPAPAAPVTTTTTAPIPAQPVIQPAAPTGPKMMQPIIDPRDSKPAKKAAPKPPEVKKPKIEKPAAPTPVPPQKPVVETPQPETKAPESAVRAPAVPAVPVAPIAPEKKEEPVPKNEALVEPVKRDPKESAIKGPKTMPALPTETIDEQKIFEAKPVPEDKTILERQQENAKKAERLEAIVAAPKPNVAPAKLEAGAQGALKKSIPFQQGQIGLSSAEIDPLAVAVTNELKGDEKEDWRVQIKAYATPYGTGVSSDKRIALSRALSLRSALIAQGVPAARIDVMAEGMASDASKPGDRIDLYLYGPSKD